MGRGGEDGGVTGGKTKSLGPNFGICKWEATGYDRRGTTVFQYL